VLLSGLLVVVFGFLAALLLVWLLVFPQLLWVLVQVWAVFVVMLWLLW
jgi:hypothetical protein